MEQQKSVLKMIKMSDVQSQEIQWLWYPFIPYGKLTIVQGDPGYVLFIRPPKMALQRTLENAKKELGIRARKNNNSWYWELDKVKAK